MEKTESLKEIERRAYRSTFEDGIYDIQFGLLFRFMKSYPKPTQEVAHVSR